MNIADELIESLTASLEAVPGAKLVSVSWEEEVGEQLRPDAIIKTMIGDRVLFLVTETRADVFPRDAREVVWQLKRYQDDQKSSNRCYIPMILAKSVSDGARAFLQDEHVGYHDLSGSLYVYADDVLIFIDRPKPKSTKRRDIGVFRGSRAQVLQALFARRGDWVTGTEIAERAAVSPATVSQTFTELERREWLETRGEGPAKRRRLSRSDTLLDAWRDSILSGRMAKRARYYVPRMKPGEIARQIEKEAPDANIDLEITGQFAAQSYTPFLSNVSGLTVRVRGTRERELLVSILGARKVSEGANLTVIDSGTNKLSRHMNYEEDLGLFASPLQVYLDLLEDHGRSKEMAEHLRSQRLV